MDALREWMDSDLDVIMVGTYPNSNLFFYFYRMTSQLKLQESRAYLSPVGFKPQPGVGLFLGRPEFHFWFNKFFITRLGRRDVNNTKLQSPHRISLLPFRGLEQILLGGHSKCRASSTSLYLLAFRLARSLRSLLRSFGNPSYPQLVLPARAGCETRPSGGQRFRGGR